MGEAEKPRIRWRHGCWTLGTTEAAKISGAWIGQTYAFLAWVFPVMGWGICPSASEFIQARSREHLLACQRSSPERRASV
jgi:hypothetical protein